MHEAIEGRLISERARIVGGHRRGKSVIAAMALAMAATWYDADWFEPVPHRERR